MPDYARACRPPDYAPNYAIMPSIMALMARALSVKPATTVENSGTGPRIPQLRENRRKGPLRGRVIFQYFASRVGCLGRRLGRAYGERSRCAAPE